MYNPTDISVRKRSVVDECCRQACTLSDLEAYCAPGPGVSNNILYSIYIILDLTTY